jgi:hypothetical protein
MFGGILSCGKPINGNTNTPRENRINNCDNATKRYTAILLQITKKNADGIV